MRSDTSRCTIILPVFNEEGIVERITTEVFKAFLMANIDILFVDDGSTDSTWDTVAELSKKNPLISGIRFSRNFGKESAMLAGVSVATGDCMIVMDSDLQHPPEIAMEMLDLWLKSDCSIIEAVKIRRQDENALKKIAANIFYKILHSTSGIDLHNGSDFKLLDRRAADIIKSMPERQTFFRAMAGWTGLKTEKVFFEVPLRAGGSTKFSVFKLTKMAINSITAYTSMPMQVVTFIGFGFLLFAIIMTIQTFYRYFFGYVEGGFPTVIILLLIIGSILMISLGIIGIYISKIYNEVKLRPRYILSESVGVNLKKMY